MKSHKKGQMSLNDFRTQGMTIGIGVLVLAMLVLVIAQTVDSPSLGTDTNLTNQHAILGNGSAGLLNLVTQMPLIGTIIGLAVLIGVVIIGFRLARST